MQVSFGSANKCSLRLCSDEIHTRTFWERPPGRLAFVKTALQLCTSQALHSPFSRPLFFLLTCASRCPLHPLRGSEGKSSVLAFTFFRDTVVLWDKASWRLLPAVHSKQLVIYTHLPGVRLNMCVSVTHCLILGRRLQPTLPSLWASS